MKTIVEINNKNFPGLITCDSIKKALKRYFGDFAFTVRELPEQQMINQKYLLDAIDKIHSALCTGKSGTWQMRVEQTVEAAKKQHNWREELAKDLVEYLSIYDDRDVSHTETFIRNWKPKEANAIQ
jgi:hypothetical protein